MTAKPQRAGEPFAVLIAACALAVGTTAFAAPGALAPYFENLPAGTDPATISRRVTDQFLTTRPENYKPAGYYGNKGYGWNRIVQYSVVSLWMNAIACARLTDDEYRVKRLVRLFDDFLPGGAKHKVCSRPRHVDDAIFGSLPLEIYIAGGQQAYDNKTGGQQAYNNKGNKAYLDMGLMYADTQWCEPCEASFKERESAPPDVQREYYAKGLSVQTRLWIDDMYMITALQSQAYRATGDRKYIERAAAEMIFYLDKLQLKDGPAKGLFYHAPDVPFVWGRGDGWMAAGMALLLDQLPEDSPHRARIMDGYKLMMATLLTYQRKDGLWSQLIDRPDDPRNWGESSCTAMFTYAYLVGIRRGWLDGAKYGPAARDAYDALCTRMDKWGNVAGTCEGTGKRNNLDYYFKRHQVNGDPHAQAPMLWIASTLLADGAGAVKGIKTPATSKLFETRVDPESGVVSYALVYGAPDDNRQSLYFITKSMTEDGRFLLFNYTVGNEKKPKRSPKILMVADLLNDTVKPVARAEKISRENIESRTPFVGDPFIECKENYVVFGSPKLGGFFRCDLAEPSKAVKLCGLPKGLDDGEYKAERYYTHLTLTKDRKRAFLDTALVNAEGKHRWVQGMLDLATGDFDKWGETPFCCNHGQVNPADDTLAMCAWEACWEKDGQEYRKKTGWYPRMWLMRKGWREMIPAKDRNFASHEIWDDDGKGFSWCGRPGDYVYHHDLATGKQERWCGISGARHNNVSPDKKYVVCDDAPERWWRGCKWRVGFWNRETGKHVWLYSTRPPLMPQDNQSKMHPDPHPHFVMQGQYVVCTANNADGHMDLYVTPVAQMVKMTRENATGPAGRVDAAGETGRSAGTVASALAERILPSGTERTAYDVILSRLCTADKAADDAWRGLKSRAEYDAYRATMHERYVAAVGGLSFKRTPLNARITEKVARNGYRIEKVLFESRPGVYVTALLFLPDEAKFKPPYRGIILSCGHAADGKGSVIYQRGAVQGALAGFAVLIYDPISQGEREQVPGGRCCEPHNRYGGLAALLGQSTAQQRIWDGMRCIDYLYSREDVRKDGVGCMGNSGGGTGTALLESVDPRIVAACPSCFISSLREVCTAIGPQDAEQNVFGQLAFGLNHAGYVLLGGNAVRMHCCFNDFFPIRGSRETYSVVTDTARNCGLDARRYGMTDVPGPHGWKESTRTSSVQWMRRRLAGDESTPEIDVEACRRLDVGFDVAKVEHGLDTGKGGRAKAMWNVTPGGRVADLPGFKSIYDYLKDDLATAEARRPVRDEASLAKIVCTRAAIRPLADVGATVREARAPEALADGTTVVREICSFADGRLVPALTFIPKGGAKGALIILDDRPDRKIHAWRVNDALGKGKTVMVADLSCTGETGKNKHVFYGIKNADEGPAVMLYMLGKSMVGLRAEETIALADALRRRTGFPVEVAAHGRTCIPAAHARAVRRDLVSHVTCLRSPKSWAQSVRTSDYVPFASVVNGALLDYDWTDLVK